MRRARASVDSLVAAPNVTSALSNVQPGLPVVFTLTDLMANVIDRPLGATPSPVMVGYRDRYLVVTREKLTSLAVGAGMTVAVPFAEPPDPILGGNATLYVRVERIQ